MKKYCECGTKISCDSQSRVNRCGRCVRKSKEKRRNEI